MSELFAVGEFWKPLLDSAQQEIRELRRENDILRSQIDALNRGLDVLTGARPEHTRGVDRPDESNLHFLPGSIRRGDAA